jgi:hypothetical protein
MDLLFTEDSDTQDQRNTRLPPLVAHELKSWIIDHQENPYPTREQLESMTITYQLPKAKLDHWFLNVRKRQWKPVREGRRGAKNAFENALEVVGPESARPRKKMRQAVECEAAAGSDEDLNELNFVPIDPPPLDFPGPDFPGPIDPIFAFPGHHDTFFDFDGPPDALFDF